MRSVGGAPPVRTNETFAPDHSIILSAQAIRKVYLSPQGARVTVLDGVDLEVRRGEFFSLVGPSGCGKTTLLRILHGLIQPTAGRVSVNGVLVTKPGFDRGFVFQESALWPWRTVVGNIVYGLEVQGVSRREAQQRAHALIELVGLRGHEQYYPHQISGGMKQRVNLARALAVDPDVLLMDEPFAALDAQTRESMQLELLRIWGVSAKTVVFVTHQIDEAVYLSDRVAVFTNSPGRIKDVLSIGLPRPRSLADKRSPEASRYESLIWASISEEVQRRASASD